MIVWGERGPLTTNEVIKRYNTGWVGAYHSQRQKEKLLEEVTYADGQNVAYKFGFAGAGKGKLSLPYRFAYEHWPNCWPCPGQETGDCFAAGTMVLGDVIKPIEEVEIGEQVWTGEGKLTTVISRREIRTVKPLLEIHVKGNLPIYCTPDHKILTYYLPKVTDKRINPSRYEFAKNGDKDNCDVITLYEQRRATWTRACDLTDSHYLLTPIDFKQSGLPEHQLTSTDDGLMLLGYFLGDGHANNGSVQIATSLDQEHIANIEQTFLNNGYKAKVRDCKGRNAKTVQVHCTELATWLREQFYKDKIKNYPGWAIGNKSFLTGLMLADGHIEEGTTFALDNTSLSVIHGARATAIMLGYEPTLIINKPSRGTFANAKKCYRLKFKKNKQKQYIWRDEQFVCQHVEKIEHIEGPHTVYDIGVEDKHHSFLANGLSASNCVSHSGKNCGLVTIGVEASLGTPDEETGLIEGYPTVSALAEAQGVVACENIYGERGHRGQGASCYRLIRYVTGDGAGGIMLRKNYPKLGIDLEKYSVNLGIGWGGTRQGTPPEVDAVGKKHHFREATECKNHEVCRDFLAMGFPIWVCSDLGFSNVRDENGYSRRKGSWGHSWIICGYDDRPSTIRVYNHPNALFLHDWSLWNSGGRRILDTKYDIPEGTMWIDATLLDDCDTTAMGGQNGWPRPKIPDYESGVF